MSDTAIKTLVALDAGVSREGIQSALPSGTLVDVVGLVEGLEEIWSTLQETPNDLLIVACSGYSDRVLYLIDGAVKERPDRPVVVMCEGSANGFVQRVFDAGADDFIALPQTPNQVMFALQKAVARKQGAAVASGVATAPLICVIGPKGGTGKTLTTANLAFGLAKSGKRVAVVDLDLQFGDVGLSLGLRPDRTIYDLAQSGGTLDADKMEAYLTKHESGVSVLLAPIRPDQASAVTVELLRNVYASLRTTYDFVIVDTPPGFTPEVIATIDSSSDVCMVAMLDALSLKNTKLGFETLELMGYSEDRIRFVLNRADSRVGISAEDVRGIVGHAPDVAVPSSRDIPRAVNEGVPIISAEENSEAAKAFRSLASLYLGDRQPQQDAGSRSRFSRLTRRKVNENGSS